MTTDRAQAETGRARPTMRDVATAAHVSIKTVSRVVNDESGVRDATRERVLGAVEALGFQRNELARSLRHGRQSASIGLVIGDLANPFYSSIARAAEQVARAHGHLLIAGSNEEQADVAEALVSTLIARRVDGLLIVPAGEDHASLIAEQRRGCPLVFLDRPPRNIDADTVLLDERAGTRSAVAHLLGHGHRRIGFVGDALSIHTGRQRFDAYCEELAASGLAVDPTLVRVGSHDVESAQAATASLLAVADPPTAIFATNNRNTIGVMQALRSAGRDVGVVGFDDFELAELLYRPVTVVAHDPGELGRIGADLLFKRIAGDTGPSRHIRVPTTLIDRGSGEMHR